MERDPIVTTTILSEPANEEIKAEKRIARKKHRRKNIPKIKKSTEAISEQNIPAKTWLSAISNLALLLAIFTIVFAAHRAIRVNQKQITESPVAAAPEVSSDEKAEEPAPEKQIAEESESPSESPKVETQKVVSKKRNIYTADPYTDGGALDLDRTKLNGAMNGHMSENSNPWNSGGHMDLDGESARNEYKKHYLSSAESVTTP
jgi:zona occludens toxin (predicted ATPase)